MDMTMKEYLARPEMGASALEMLIENARKYKLSKDGKINLWTKEKDIGTVFHTLILEPHLKDKVFVVSDSFRDEVVACVNLDDGEIIVVNTDSRRKGYFQNAKKSNPGKMVLLTDEYEDLERLRSFSGKIVLTPEEYESVIKMVNKVMELKDFKEWLENGKKEQTYFGEISGIPFKIRCDLIVPVGEDPSVVQVFDLKSMFDEATPHNFGKASAARFYFLSEIIYRKILKQNGFTVAGYSFIGASKVDWSGADYFKHQELIVGNEDYEMEGEAQKILDYGIAKYKYCMKNNIWPERAFDFAANQFPVVSEVILPMWPFFKYQ